MQRKKIIIISAVSILLVIALAFLLIQKNKKVDAVVETKSEPVEVLGRTIKDAATLKETIEYPALVSADQEVKIIAKTSGNIKGFNLKPGDKVKAGQVFARIDDPSSNDARSGGYNANQIKQAQIGLNQAAASYQLARTNYQNLLISSQKDITQLEIARSQAKTGESNLGFTASEALKSAEIGYETAKVASEQARLNLENRRKSIGQSEADTATNASASAVAAANSCRSVITGLNNIIGFDTSKGLSIAYKKNLGAMDSASLVYANRDYEAALEASNSFESARFQDASRMVDAAIELAEKTKTLADSAKLVIENTFASIELPQSSQSGNSLNSLISAVNGYQAQASALILQANSAKQALVNAPIGNTASLDALEKAYELAKKQEAAAKQSLNNLKAGNRSQLDQASYGSKAAANSLDAARSKIDSQIAVAKTQVDIASLQYQNAAASLQSLYDIHEAVSPIDGTITSKGIDENEAVSAGQVIATVSRIDEIKLGFYIDQESLSNLKLGQAAKIKDSDGTEFPAKIISITPQADSVTKRYLVEASPDRKDSKNFALGSVMDISLEITRRAQDKDAFLLPLSAVEVSQNGNSIYIVKENRAAKAPVEILKVIGEAAEVKDSLPKDTIVIIEGNRLVKEGDEVSLKF